jgi:hypothetical protein
MSNACTLVLSVSSPITPDVKVLLNNQLVSTIVTKDEFNNFIVSFSENLNKDTTISIIINNLTNPNFVKLVDIVIDDIRFGLVTFLCTTVNNKQDTQIKMNEQIDIQLRTPIWQFWCEKMNAFNYKDYPLGSIG